MITCKPKDGKRKAREKEKERKIETQYNNISLFLCACVFVLKVLLNAHTLMFIPQRNMNQV